MRKKIIFFILITLLALAYSIVSFSSFYQLRSYGENQIVIIPPGSGARAIIAQLHREGLIPNPIMIALPLLVKTNLQRLKAGEYALNAAMSPAQIFDKISRGDIVIHKLTIPEGWNSFQVRMALMNEPLLTGDVPAVIPEGSVFPDTILFQRNQSRLSVLEAMQKRMRDVLARAWQNRDKNLWITTPEDALILASMVEKETSLRNERATIAGVFYNRLRMGMRLQSDPTVVYGIEAAQAGMTLGRSLTTYDLKYDTSFNTYTRGGLPLTPICNPGAEAIQAVLHPEPTSALFFVATGHGGHAFATTLREHHANVTSYRLARLQPQ